MGKFPMGGLIGRAAGLVRYLSEKKISLHASSACYFLTLSVFPMLVLLLGLLRYTGLGADALVEALSGVVPQALLPFAKKLIISAYRNTSGALLSVSAVTALWSASRGIYGLLKGLSSIYDGAGLRGYWYMRAISVVYTFAFLLVLVMTLVLGVFGNEILAHGQVEQYPFLAFLAQVIDMRFFVLLGVLTGFFCLVYMYLPNVRNTFMDSLPGALLTTIGWLLFTQIYSGYATKFSGYADIYGSVYTVALSMLWLYCCINLVFYGGALNRYLSKEQ